MVEDDEQDDALRDEAELDDIHNVLRNEAIEEHILQFHALIVTCLEFDSLPPLELAIENDARKLRETLIDPKYCALKKANVKWLQNPTVTTIRVFLEEHAKKCVANGFFLLYIATRGLRISRGKLQGSFLCASDTSIVTEEELSQSSLSTPELATLLAAIPAVKKFIVVDASHEKDMFDEHRKDDGSMRFTPFGHIKGRLNSKFYSQLHKAVRSAVVQRAKDIETAEYRKRLEDSRTERRRLKEETRQRKKKHRGRGDTGEEAATEDDTEEKTKRPNSPFGGRPLSPFGDRPFSPLGDRPLSPGMKKTKRGLKALKRAASPTANSMRGLVARGGALGMINLKQDCQIEFVHADKDKTGTLSFHEFYYLCSLEIADLITEEEALVAFKRIKLKAAGHVRGELTSGEFFRFFMEYGKPARRHGAGAGGDGGAGSGEDDGGDDGGDVSSTLQPWDAQQKLRFLMRTECIFHNASRMSVLKRMGLREQEVLAHLLRIFNTVDVEQTSALGFTDIALLFRQEFFMDEKEAAAAAERAFKVIGLGKSEMMDFHGLHRYLFDMAEGPCLKKPNPRGSEMHPAKARLWVSKHVKDLAQQLAKGKGDPDYSIADETSLRQQAGEVFNKLDRNGNGAIMFDELQALLQEVLQENVSDGLAQDCLNIINGFSGRDDVDFQAFLGWYNQPYKSTASPYIKLSTTERRPRKKRSATTGVNENLADGTEEKGAGADARSDTTVSAADDVAEKEADVEKEEREKVAAAQREDEQNFNVDRFLEMLGQRLARKRHYQRKEHAKKNFVSKIDRKFRAECKASFDRTDNDRSGLIDQDELYLVLRLELCEPITKKHSEGVMRQLDSDGSGQIDFEEFFNWYSSNKDAERDQYSIMQHALRLALRARRAAIQSTRYLNKAFGDPDHLAECHTIVLGSATIKNQTALHNSHDGLSVFMHYLIKGLKGSACFEPVINPVNNVVAYRDSSLPYIMCSNLCDFVLDHTPADVDLPEGRLQTPVVIGKRKRADFAMCLSPKPPPPPSKPVCMERNGHGMSFKFQGSLNHAEFSPTTGYQIQCRGMGRINNKWLPKGATLVGLDDATLRGLHPGMQISMGGLLPDVPYVFRVRARNAGGWSRYSPNSDIVRTNAPRRYFGRDITHARTNESLAHLNATGPKIMMRTALKQGGAVAVVEAMRQNPNSREVQEMGAHSLTTLCNQDWGHANVLADDASAKVMLEAMETFRRSCGIQRCGLIAFERMACQGFVLDAELTDRLEAIATVATATFSSDAGICSAARTAVKFQRDPPIARHLKPSANSASLAAQLCWHRYVARRNYVAVIMRTFECKVDNTKHAFFFRNKKTGEIKYRLPLGIGEKDLTRRITEGARRARLEAEERECARKERETANRVQREKEMLEKLKGAELEALKRERAERAELTRMSKLKAQARFLFDAIDTGKDGELDDVEFEMFVQTTLKGLAMDTRELEEACGPIGRAPSGGIKFKQFQTFYCLPPDEEHGEEPYGEATNRLLRSMRDLAVKAERMDEVDV